MTKENLEAELGNVFDPQEVQAEEQLDTEENQEPEIPTQDDQTDEQTDENVDQVDSKKDEKTNTEPSSEEEQQPPPKEEVQDDWTKKAVIDERRKRQQLESELEKLKKQIQSGEQQESTDEQDYSELIEDPKRFAASIRKQIENDLFNERVLASQEEMKATHNDYDELESEFIDLSKQDPSLHQRLRKSLNPAKFAYDTAKKAREVKNFSDPNFVAAERERIKKEVLAELVKNQPKSQEAPGVVLPNLTQKASKGSNTDQQDQYQGSLEEVFGN